ITSPIQVVARTPGDCLSTEIEDFIALVLAGGEVTPKGLEDRIRQAVSLTFLTLGCCLCGVAALKRPGLKYRQRVSSHSGVGLPEHQFPYELGWVFVMPSSRGRRFSEDLTRTALSSAGTQGVFSTSRTDNPNMHATLAKFRFVPEGQSWASVRSDHKLQLFLRRAAQQPAAAHGGRALAAG